MRYDVRRGRRDSGFGIGRRRGGRARGREWILNDPWERGGGELLVSWLNG